MKKQSVLVCHLKHHPTITPAYICFLGHMNCHICVTIRVSLCCYFLDKKFENLISSSSSPVLLHKPHHPFITPAVWGSDIPPEQTKDRWSPSPYKLCKNCCLGRRKWPYIPNEGREEVLCSWLLRLAIVSESKIICSRYSSCQGMVEGTCNDIDTVASL